MLWPDLLLAASKAIGSGGFQSLNASVGEDVHSCPSSRVYFDRIRFARQDDLIRVRKIVQIAFIDQLKAACSNCEERTRGLRYLTNA
jgi:hypothetical protein